MTIQICMCSKKLKVDTLIIKVPQNKKENELIIELTPLYNVKGTKSGDITKTSNKVNAMSKHTFNSYKYSDEYVVDDDGNTNGVINIKHNGKQRIIKTIEC